MKLLLLFLAGAAYAGTAPKADDAGFDKDSKNVYILRALSKRRVKEQKKM